jgi:hypothetical protein
MRGMGKSAVTGATNMSISTTSIEVEGKVSFFLE